ncbi:MAG TPA: RNA methyltransferase [Candidatus Rifleibacterium sp.]|nr:RNA methyltransferase [Candidatus Rifleibacterium sp.]HPT48152.1 RNA methyltransferase [Candidatus Rifleibacterium sp.]
MPTVRRTHRISQTLHQRQLDIVIALDFVHDQHNLSAVLRTADASGFGRVIWAPDIKKPENVNPEVSKGSERWVDLRVVDDLKASLLELRGQGYQIAATHMGREAVDFRTVDWTTPWVVIFGNEHRGCSNATVEMADKNIFLPMAGFVQSLNISVAAAVTMYEIQRQRQLAGFYQRNASAEQVRLLYDQWRLADEELTLEDLYQRPAGPLPPPDQPHKDGRADCPFFRRHSKAAESE